MSDAVVLYLAEGHRVPVDFDPQAALAEIGLDPAWVEVASGAPGGEGLVEALHRLVTRGARRVDAVSAWFDGEGRLCPGASSLRLHG